ncbi:MAG: hypothetical protein ACU826_01385 [Gammaproteobacteria bacterium]
MNRHKINYLAFISAAAAAASFPPAVLALSEAEIKAIASINLASIVVNGIVRIAAIVAGVYIVWLGHDTLIRGVKGEFEFKGHFGKLKGSVPGLLFVLLGSLAIGWALKTTASGGLDIEQPSSAKTAVTERAPRPGSSLPPGDSAYGPESPARPSNAPPDFISGGKGGKENE